MPEDTPISPSPDELARLLASAAQARVPHELVEQFERRWLPDPDRGQVWRLAHANHAALAMIWAPGPTTVSVLPVSEDPDYCDAHTVVLTETPLHAPTGVWPSLEVSVPTWSLDRCIGQVDADAVAASRRAFRAQEGEPPNSPPGDRLWSDLGRYRKELADRFEHFVALTWADERPTVEGATTLDQLLRKRGHDLRWLGSRLEIAEPAVALLAWQGRRSLNDREASMLASELEVDADDLRRLSRNIPGELRAQTNRPRFRPQVQAWASLQHLSEFDAREQIEERILALAARSVGDESDRWQALLEQFLTEELASP